MGRHRHRAQLYQHIDRAAVELGLRRAGGDLGRKQAIAQILDQGQAMLEVGCEHPRRAEAGAGQDGADGDERAHHVLGQMRDLCCRTCRREWAVRRPGVERPSAAWVCRPAAGGHRSWSRHRPANSECAPAAFAVPWSSQAQGGAEALRLGTKLAQPAHQDAAAVARLGIGEFDFVAILGQKRGDAVGPFGKHGAALKRVLEAKFQCLLGDCRDGKNRNASRSVAAWHRSAVHGEGRARHLDIGIQERPDQRAGKGGFAGAQLAFEHDEAADLSRSANSSASRPTPASSSSRCHEDVMHRRPGLPDAPPTPRRSRESARSRACRDRARSRATCCRRAAPPGFLTIDSPSPAPRCLEPWLRLSKRSSTRLLLLLWYAHAAVRRS